MLAFLNLGVLELVVIAAVAVLVFGKDLPQAASKAYLQVRKLRNAVDDLRRDSGIERELRNIENTVRAAEWEARRKDPVQSPATVARGALPESGGGSGAASAAVPPPPPAPEADSGRTDQPGGAPSAPTDAAS
ncbi:MAG: hypothetical protein HOP15_18580 [Planctomycetes bacterium]|nr:hypothetical protein [Planctomycetota bacterium]